MNPLSNSRAHLNSSTFRCCLFVALQFDEAAVSVARALAIEPHDPWAIHVQAHLLYAAGVVDREAGSGWLESRQALWQQCMSFLFVHCWFHDALLRLDADDFDQTLHIVDKYVWPFKQEEAPAPPSAPVPRKEKEGQETSFGVPCTALSFQRNDRFYVEDQNGALNLLWRIEMRTAGAGRPQSAAGFTDAASSSSAVAASAASSSFSSPSSSAAAAASFVLPSLNSRWASIVSCLTLPPSQPLSLFGLLQLHALGRLGRLSEAQQVNLMFKAEVAKVADSARREQLEGPQTSNDTSERAAR